MKLCHKCVVTGRVQGVFYRHSTSQEAIKRGITGWVRNLPSGEVECLICGEEAVVLEMIEWLKRGPPAAKVTEVAVSPQPWEEFTGFEIIR